MKTAIKISKHSISLSNSDIDFRNYEEEIADFLLGIKAKAILSTDKFIPWEKVKQKIESRPKPKK
jgi:hypothetical protein